MHHIDDVAAVVAASVTQTTTSKQVTAIRQQPIATNAQVTAIRNIVTQVTAIMKTLAQVTATIMHRITTILMTSVGYIKHRAIATTLVVTLVTLMESVGDRIIITLLALIDTIVVVMINTLFFYI